jgi:plasmid stabilization system protein ParE
VPASYDLTLFAQDDIDDAADDIDDAVQAAQWVEAIHDGLEQLGRMSGLGHRRADITSQDVFFWSWHRWAVIYQKKNAHTDRSSYSLGQADIQRMVWSQLVMSVACCLPKSSQGTVLLNPHDLT